MSIFGLPNPAHLMHFKARFHSAELELVAVFERLWFVGGEDLPIQARLVARILVFHHPCPLTIEHPGVFATQRHI